MKVYTDRPSVGNVQHIQVPKATTTRFQFRKLNPVRRENVCKNAMDCEYLHLISPQNQFNLNAGKRIYKPAKKRIML